MIGTLLLAIAAPQIPQGLPLDDAPQARYPREVASAAWPGFESASRVTTAAAGAADVDGDGNPDVWHLASQASAAHAGEFSVKMANTADLGRFIPYTTTVTSGAVDAATLREAGSLDTIAWIDPGFGSLLTLDYVPPPTGSPRAGQWQWGLRADVAVGFGCYELETADHEGDGIDDVLVLQDTPLNGAPGTTIHKLRRALTTQIVVIETVSLTLPGRVTCLRTLDWNADGRTDVAAMIDGVGAFVFVDDHSGSFGFAGGLSLPSGVTNDVFTGDLNGDGRDDMGAVLDAGAWVALSTPAGPLEIALVAPAEIAPLSTARVVGGPNASRDTLLVGAGGGGFALYRATLGQFEGPALNLVDSSAPGGAGTLGQAAFTFDADNDGDLDLALQLADGAAWVLARNERLDLGAIRARAETVGTASGMGWVQQRFTLDVGTTWANQGLQDLEFAIFVQNPHTQEQEFWSRQIVQPDAQGHVVLTVQALIDPSNYALVYDNEWRTHPITGEITCFGETVISIHAKSGTRRHATRTMVWDGHGDPQKSAVGVKWKVIAAPPLPTADEDLLPWD